jgi:hypothetical protein
VVVCIQVWAVAYVSISNLLYFPGIYSRGDHRRKYDDESRCAGVPVSMAKLDDVKLAINSCIFI